MDTLLLNADGQPMGMIPLSVIPATKALQMVYLGKVRVLKEYDDWTINSQSGGVKVPSMVMATKHKKWDRQIKYSRGNIFLRDDFTCQLQSTNRCKDAKGKGHKLTELTLDHVVPRSLGGKSTWTNVCTACKDCNSTKGNDKSIVPKKMPVKPSYYEILAKRKTMPIQIREEEWKFYIDWPEDLVHLIPFVRHQLREPD